MASPSDTSVGCDAGGGRTDSVEAGHVADDQQDAQEQLGREDRAPSGCARSEVRPTRSQNFLSGPNLIKITISSELCEADVVHFESGLALWLNSRR